MNTFLVELVIRSFIIACLGLALRFALTRFSAQARAKVLTLTMVALAILPLAMLMLPKVPVTVGRVEVEAPALTVADQVAAPAASNLNWWAIAWLSIMAIFVVRVLVSLVRFRKIEQSLSLASEPVTVRVRSLTSRAKGVFYSPEGEPPMTWGVVRPKIALPTESETWIEPEFRSVVLHEDAHIRRRDWAVTIGFRFIAALYWFNPCVWLLQAYFEQDSERAADDFVLAQGFDAPEYAEQLLDVAQKLRPGAGRLPAVTMARTNRLNGRLRAILSSRTPREPMKGWKKVTVLGALACGALAGGFVLPVIERLPVFKSESYALSNSKTSSVQNTNFEDDFKADDSATSVDSTSPQKDAPEVDDSHMLGTPITEAFGGKSETPTSSSVAKNSRTESVSIHSEPDPVSAPEPVATPHVAMASGGVDEDEPDFDDMDNFDPTNLQQISVKARQEAAKLRMKDAREAERVRLEVEREQMRAKREADREYADAQRDMAQAQREAERDIEQASKEVEREMRKATLEMEKSGICINQSAKDIKNFNFNAKSIAEGAKKFGEVMAKNALTMVGEFGFDDKGSKGKKSKSSSASGKSNSHGSESSGSSKRSKNP